ncbi:MAG TPA: polysaccharide biosynthesis C-terminal domain-containing protein [Acidimicrobiales bacterium]|nr:polysaccharide biosynthesis C-terminal domain-containing protein [Acidimicrobiales bacterium]
MAETESKQSDAEAPLSIGRFLGRGASTSFVLQASAVVLNYVTNIVFARTLGVAEFGVFTYVTNWARIGGGISHLSMASSGLRFVAEHSAAEDWPEVKGVIRTSRQLPVFLGGAAAVIGSVVILAVQGRTAASVAMVLALWIIPTAGLIEMQETILQAYRLIFRAFFPWLVFQPIVAIGLALGALLFGVHVSASMAVAIMFGSYVAALALQGVWLHAATPAQVHAARPAYEYRAWTKVTAPIFLSNVVSIVFTRLDVVMVGIFLGAKEAGIYAVAMRAGNLAQIGQSSMAAIVSPRISQLYWANREDELQDLALTSVRWIFFPSVALTALMFVFANPILSVFGHAFIAGRWVLIWIALGQLVSVSSGPVGWLMNLTGRQNTAAKVFGATAAVTVVGYIVLIPWLGIVGAAIANAGAIAVRNLVMSWFARRSLGYNVSVWASLRRRHREQA